MSDHLEDIWDFYRADYAHPQDWTYLSYEPFSDISELRNLVEDHEKSTNPYFLVARDKTQNHKVLATCALMRINPQNRSCEMGQVIYAPAFRKTRAATELQFLVRRYVFEELHARRYEWKCDSLNLPSRRAAERLGFTYEGRFRNAVVYKGRSRDTDWFSVIATE